MFAACFADCGSYKPLQKGHDCIAVLNEYESNGSKSHVAFFRNSDLSWEIYSSRVVGARMMDLTEDSIKEFIGNDDFGVPQYQTWRRNSIDGESFFVHLHELFKSSRYHFYKSGDTIYYQNLDCKIKNDEFRFDRGVAYILNSSDSTLLFTVVPNYSGNPPNPCYDKIGNIYVRYTGRVEEVIVGKMNRKVYVFERIPRYDYDVEDMINYGWAYIDCEWLIPVAPSVIKRLSADALTEVSLSAVYCASVTLDSIKMKFSKPDLTLPRNDPKFPWNRYDIFFE